MKALGLLGSVLIFVSLICGGLSAQETKLVDSARVLLSRAKGNPSLENLNLVGEQIYSLSRYADKNDLVAESLRRELIEGLISIPGHAQLIADEIRREQAEVAHLPVKPIAQRNAYNRHREHYLLLILPNLPSPETIRVLGDFLSDEEDYPPPPVSGDMLANCDHAMKALMQISLRDPADKASVVLGKDWYEAAKSRPFDPTTPSPYNLDIFAMKAWRTWWQEVKSGKKAFSFKGQNVEYRFEPDGTWKSTPLNLTKEQLQTETMSKSTSDEAKLPAPLYSTQLALPAISNRWYWLGSSAVFLFILAWWAIHKRPTAS